MLYKDYKIKLAIPAYQKQIGAELKFSEFINYPKNDDDRNGDVWYFKPSANWLIKHYKVQEIRRLAGLVIYKEPQLIVSPTIENGMTAVWSGSMRLPKDRKKVDLLVGEANKANCKIDYVVSMAYKRWYDRAVLDALELYELYSDIEGIQDQVKNSDVIDITDLDDAEVTVLQPFVKSINEAKDPELLTEYGKGLKEQIAVANVSEKAVKVLRSLYDKKLKELNGKTF